MCASLTTARPHTRRRSLPRPWTGCVRTWMTCSKRIAMESWGLPKMDKYDEQIARLTANPEGIGAEWSEGIGLFKLVKPNEALAARCGCLTMIRSRNSIIHYVAI